MELQTNENGRVVKRKLKMKRVILAGAIGSALIVSLMWMAIGALADFMNPAREDRDTSESLDKIAEVQSKSGTGYDVTVVWDDQKVQKTIHAMTHQKVEADQKWTSIEMTKERIETLSQIIDQNESTLDYYGTYRSILDKWMEGNFDSVDRDHNSIWSLQNGTIGKATGIMSAEQEKEFVEKVFD